MQRALAEGSTQEADGVQTAGSDGIDWQKRALVAEARLTEMKVAGACVHSSSHGAQRSH